jgi:hypothetical protein
VGSNGGVPANAYGQFTLTASSTLANNPLVGVTTVLDLSACLDLEICADQLDPDAVVNLAQHDRPLTKLTGANGQVHVHRPRVRERPAREHASQRRADLRRRRARRIALGEHVRPRRLRAAVDANDMSAWLGDFFTAQLFGRSDYDCSGWVGANDLSMWFGAFGSGTMAESCASHCP